jgi:hypothetical protein
MLYPFALLISSLEVFNKSILDLQVLVLSKPNQGVGFKIHECMKVMFLYYCF